MDRNWIKPSNLILSAVLIVALLGMTVCGCANEKSQDGSGGLLSIFDTAGTKENYEDEEIPELMEPANVGVNFEVASYRDVIVSKVYPCLCCPKTTEYEYTSDELFGRYGKLPGEEVVPGDVLIYGSIDELKEQEKELQKEILRKAKDYVYEYSDLQEDLFDAKKATYEIAEPYMDMLSVEPEDEESEWYKGWANGFVGLELSYKGALLNERRIEQAMKEKEERYKLEAEYDAGRVDRLQAKEKESQVISNENGVVVIGGYYYPGDTVPKNTPVIAVGDPQSKTFHPDYISKGEVTKAKDIYAFVNGKRYEVTYEVMEKEEYQRLKKKNDKVYSTFYISDPNNEIAFGDFGALVVVKDIAQNVLSVPIESVKFEGTRKYVYILDENGATSVRDVETGIKDEMYIEITSGLNEGDRVRYSKSLASTGKTKRLEKGDISGEYTAGGYMYYPSTEWMINPAKEGSAYIKKLCVKQYEKVTKGQVLAQLEVNRDDVDISRIERKIQRQQERLLKLLEKKKKNYSDEIDRNLERAIEGRQRSIDNLMEELAESKEYSGTIDIVSPCDGIITRMTELEEGDLLYYRDKLMQVADESLSYVVIEDKEGVLSYGNPAVISYKDENGIKQEVQGQVVSVNPSALSDALNYGGVLIAVPREKIAEMAKLGSELGSGDWWARSRFDVTIEVRSVKDVVLVPKGAVKEIAGQCFVKVPVDGQRATYQSFIAGGSTSSDYWVVDGLTEGMEICLE